MFWGLILKSNKKYTQKIDKPFHISKASLDHTTADNEPVQVMFTHEGNVFLLCTLQKGKCLQESLDLRFAADQVCFSIKGNGIVHLTGSLENDLDDFSDDDDEGGNFGSLAQLMAMSANGKKKKENGKAEKDSKSKKEASVEEDSDDDEDDDETEMDETMESMNAEEDDEDDSLDDGSDEEGSDDDEEEDDDDEDEDDSDEETAPPPKKQQKTEKPAQNGKADKKNKQKNGTENGDAKKQQQKEKPEAGKIIKMQGGLQAQELKIGGGAEARPGKKVQVYYEGRLKTNNKTFDASKSGPGFKFTLGKGEVIKGWDLGVSGMKVGGKRRLVIPPALAYGQRGSPPAIPQNATLVFDVELKNVF